MEEHHHNTIPPIVAWLGMIIGVGVLVFLLSSFNKEMGKLSVASSREATAVSTLSTKAEQTQIDTWIKENNLNLLGQPAGTPYTSDALTDPITGEAISRYDYIIERNPERPWRDITVKSNVTE